MTTENFVPLNLDEFVKLVERFDFSIRPIDQVHMHHTWRPRHRDFRGLASILAMWKFHTEVNRWADIAQHVTIDPDGTIWTGRSWRLPPASSSGHNGSRSRGPFMFETVGDFDEGHDVLAGRQREAVIGVIAAIQKRNRLAPDTLRFHRELGSPKTCPGTGIDYDEILEEVRAAHRAGARAPSRARRGAKRARAREVEAPVFVADERRIHEALTVVSSAARGYDGLETGMDECEHAPALEVTIARDGGLVERAPGARGPGAELDAAALARLRPHVVNLVQGEFIPSGIFQTTREDVDAIFSDHLQARAAAATAEQPLRIVLWAHGGLVSERSGLTGALRAVEWWKANGVYPVYFVWETGLLETIQQLVTAAGSRAPAIATRDLWDHTTDPLIEVLTRPLGSRLWAGMKRSAERASAQGGGAVYVAEQLAKLVKGAAKRVQVHAAGHSAGSIFHAHLIPRLLELGVTVESLQLAAPAVRIDTFLSRLGDDVKSRKRLKQFAMFTMAKDWEKRDNCARAYKKSLLYLISLAFEAEGKAPILGLEEFVRRDAACRAVFGLDGSPAQADVVFSRSIAQSGRHASRATAHSAFDEDPPTMNSIMRRVLGRDDVTAIVGYPEAPADRGVEEPEPLPVELALFTRPEALAAPPTAAYATGAVQVGGVAATALPGRGRRFALCIGINRYPTAPLNGCVADAEAWASTLERLGFERPRVMRDTEATRDAILAELRALVQRAREGDVVVFQYAGHGTQVPDVGGDEEGDERDEALCPVDFDDGNFVIDDDLKEVFAELGSGVNLTCFFDCCHSGTITRLAARRSGRAVGVRGGEAKPRFVRATAAQVKKHLANRGRMAARAAPRPAVTAAGMREVAFTACRSDQVAFESDGQGDFTRIAIELLETPAGDTYESFLDRVRTAFGSQARQEPQLDCAPEVLERVLLQPFAVEA
jgi:hypothetical protein